MLDAGRIGIAALSVGLAQGAYEAARDYAQERRQFGQPIAAFQAIQWKLADNATRIEAARLLTYRAAYLKDRGARTTLESSMAKLYASEIAVQGRRRLRADPRRLRLREGLSGREVLPRREATTIGEGTSEIQRLVIARQLLAPSDRPTLARRARARRRSARASRAPSR